MTFRYGFVASCCLWLLSSLAQAHAVSELRIIKAYAQDKAARTRISNLGMAIDGILADGVTLFGSDEDAAKIRALGIKVEVQDLSVTDDFPQSDKAFHNYAETEAAIDEMVSSAPELVTKYSIGKSVEGRELFGVRISAAKQWDTLPTAIFMGCHHAREHLSVEVPLKLAQYLVANHQKDSRIARMVNEVEIYIVPMVNPDGVEYDISSTSYKYWRKNRKKNDDKTYGVDLNRNYGGGEGWWGGEGASHNPSDETYAGTAEFSEPETQAVRDFVRARSKATVLLTFHSFSELILWPWGHSDDKIANETDRKVFETMGEEMSKWNKYTPQKSSELYVASGDTTDWAYAEKNIFAFTFELSPTSIFGGGFYPGAKAIEPTFKENLEPSLYLIEHAVNPYSALQPKNDPLDILN